MAYSPIALVAPNYRDYTDYWLKAYAPGTTTPKIMALDSAASVTVSKLQLNADGFLKSAGGTLVIPYIEDSYDLWLFPTEAEADANDTINAEKLADNINALNESVINDLSLTYTFKTVALMKASTIVFPVGKKIFWQGYSVESDGGSNWGLVSTGAHTDDGGSAFTLNNGNYIAANLKGNKISVLKFGARGDYDGTSGTDDNVSIQNAFIAAANGGYCYFPTTTANQYLSTATLIYYGSFGGDTGVTGVGGHGSLEGTFIVHTGSGPALEEERKFNNITIEKIAILIDGTGTNGIDIKYGGIACRYTDLWIEATSTSSNADHAIYLRGINPDTGGPTFHLFNNKFDGITTRGPWNVGIKLGDDIVDGIANTNTIIRYTGYITPGAGIYDISMNGLGSALIQCQFYNIVRFFGDSANNALIGCYFETSQIPTPEVAVVLDSNSGARFIFSAIGCQGLDSASTVVDNVTSLARRYNTIGDFTQLADIYTERVFEAQAGDGITFNNTIHVNEIDVTDKGAFSPVFAGSTNAGTFTGSGFGVYEKIGNVVTVHFTVNVTSTSELTGATGNLIITGLPFSPASPTGACCFRTTSGINATHSTYGFISGDRILLSDSVSASNLTISGNFTASSRISGSATYITA